MLEVQVEIPAELAVTAADVYGVPKASYERLA
jgi:hypothetical protein